MCPNVLESADFRVWRLREIEVIFNSPKLSLKPVRFYCVEEMWISKRFSPLSKKVLPYL